MKKLAALVSGLFLVFAFSAHSFANMGQAALDTGITTEVKTILFGDKLTGNEHFNPANVHVTTKDGVVTLTGHVKTDADKAKAAELAQKAKGVKSVDNQLMIQ
ncbi:MAG: BON domain-containing protein [Gammaproteobacteria bacterium]